MDTVAPSSPQPDPAEPPVPHAVVTATVAAEMATLARAREITQRFLERLDDVAEAMAPEELKAALVESGQMVLNLTRVDRALRQIVAMEQEVMGLREPPAPPSPRGGFGGQGRGGGEPGGGGRHDFNDLNDLHDIRDIHDLAEIEDLGEIEDFDRYDDLEALEKYDSYEEFECKRERDWEKERRKDEEESREIEESAAAELARIADMPRRELTDDEHRQAILELNAMLRAEVEADDAQLEEEWRRVRAALLKRRAVEKQARRRRGRGPP